MREFPFNNILHVQVFKMVTVVFNERSSNILADKLLEGDFLVDFLLDETKEQNYLDSANKKKYRKGNLGFITEIGSLLCLKAMENGGIENSMKEKIKACKNWTEFNDNYLK